MARISVLRPGTSIIPCESRVFFNIRFEVRVNGFVFDKRVYVFERRQVLFSQWFSNILSNNGTHFIF
jgi:hypothetical protein